MNWIAYPPPVAVAALPRRSTLPAASVEIVAADSLAARKEFVRFAYDIYRDDPHWVAPLEYERLRFIDPRVHPFFKHGAAATFLAKRKGTIVGRILVSDDPRCNAAHGTNAGCFGMFETIDDPSVSGALLDHAADWLRARGRTEVLGPIDYSLNYNCGLLVDGFNTPPRVMMNHNPRYYAPLLEDWGLTKAKDLFAWWFPRELNLTERWGKIAKRLESRTPITIRPVNMRDFWKDARRLKELFAASFADNWGFVDMSEAEFEHLCWELRPFVVPGLMLFAEHEGQVVGASMTLPDLNAAIRPLHGRLTKWGLPIGLARMFLNLRRSKVGRLMMLGVDPNFRRRGVLERLILQTFDYGANVVGFDAAELGWTLEENHCINGPIAATGAERYKTYRIYQKSL